MTVAEGTRKLLCGGQDAGYERLGNDSYQHDLPSHEGCGSQMESWGGIPTTILLPVKSRRNLVMDVL